jgi:lipopolysaccharide biosynthesis glycosyltransferase
MKRNVVVLAADKHMFPAAAFLATRLASLNRRDDVDIAIMSDAEVDLEKARPFGVPAALIQGSLPVELRRQPMKRLTAAIYFRLFVPDYLDEAVRRIMLLDVDIYPENDSLFRLFDLDMGDFAVAAVQDIKLVHAGGENYVARELAKARVSARDYLNGGVLLVDRDRFIDQRIGHRTFNTVVKEHLRIDLVLNRVLAGKWLRLSPAMNSPAELTDLLLSSGCRPVLTHFTGATKPWHGPRFASSHRARKEIETYLAKSPWRDFLSTNYDFQAAWDTLQAKKGGATYAKPPTVKAFKPPRETRPEALRDYLRNTEFADVKQGITKPGW